jgi:hypothetical protein
MLAQLLEENHAFIKVIAEKTNLGDLQQAVKCAGNTAVIKY